MFMHWLVVSLIICKPCERARCSDVQVEIQIELGKYVAWKGNTFWAHSMSGTVQLCYCFFLLLGALRFLEHRASPFWPPIFPAKLCTRLPMSFRVGFTPQREACSCWSYCLNQSHLWIEHWEDQHLNILQEDFLSEICDCHPLQAGGGAALSIFHRSNLRVLIIPYSAQSKVPRDGLYSLTFKVTREWRQAVPFSSDPSQRGMPMPVPPGSAVCPPPEDIFPIRARWSLLVPAPAGTALDADHKGQSGANCLWSGHCGCTEETRSFQEHPPCGPVWTVREKGVGCAGVTLGHVGPGKGRAWPQGHMVRKLPSLGS